MHVCTVWVCVSVCVCACVCICVCVSVWVGGYYITVFICVAWLAALTCIAYISYITHLHSWSQAAVRSHRLEKSQQLEKAQSGRHRVPLSPVLTQSTWAPAHRNQVFKPLICNSKYTQRNLMLPGFGFSINVKKKPNILHTVHNQNGLYQDNVSILKPSSFWQRSGDTDISSWSNFFDVSSWGLKIIFHLSLEISTAGL